MSQEKPIYEENQEAYDILQKIAENNPEVFGTIDLSTIGVCIITNKDRPEATANAGKRLKMYGVKDGAQLWSKKKYIVEIYRDVWDSSNIAMKSNIMVEVLYSIPPETQDGATLKEDLIDRTIMIKNFGLGYKDNPSVPDLTVEKGILKSY